LYYYKVQKEIVMNNGFLRWLAILLVGVLVTSFGIYFGINYAYLKNGEIITQWDSETALIYWGNIFGALVTIIALITTILFTNKSNRDEREFTRKTLICDFKKEQYILESKRDKEIVDWVKNAVLLVEYDENDYSTEAINSIDGRVKEALRTCNLKVQGDVIPDDFWTVSREYLIEYLYLLIEYSSKKNNIANVYKSSESAIEIIRKKNLIRTIESTHFNTSNYQEHLFRIQEKIERIMLENNVTDEELEEAAKYIEVYKRGDLGKDLIEAINKKLQAIKNQYLRLFDEYNMILDERLEKRIEGLYQS